MAFHGISNVVFSNVVYVWKLKLGIFVGLLGSLWGPLGAFLVYLELS